MSLPGAFQRFDEELEAELKAVVGEGKPPLHLMLHYHLGWADEHGLPQKASPGKRVRPVLCLLSAEAVGRDHRPAIPAAAAVELAHNFSLIHDDIQDGSPERRHRPTVWWIWGPSQAINAGDSMYALARLALFRLEDSFVPAHKVIKAAVLLDRACLRLCEGQYLDISYQGKKELSVEAYLQMAEGKTAALMSCAMELGALVSTDNEQVTRAFAQAGTKLGLAYQIQDDILDLWGEEGIGKSHAVDVLDKKKSLPIIYGFSRAEGTDREQLEAVYHRKKVVEDRDIERFIGVLESAGAREYAERTAWGFLDEAVGILRSTDIDSPGMHELIELAHYLAGRST